MGNNLSEMKDHNAKKLKSFKDIKFDVLNLNEILSNSDFVREFACRLNAKIKGNNENITYVKYQFKKELQFELELKKKDKTEFIDLTLSEFYQFYDLVVNYSISATNSQCQNIPNEEAKHDNTRGIDFSASVGTLPLQDEQNICVICFEKGIQTIMPCTHGFCESCCSLWYDKKNKKDCPLCRISLEGSWQEKSFQVFSQGNRNNATRDAIPKFINAKTLFLKIH